MKKRVLIAIAGAVMLAVLAGCGSKKSTATQTSATTAAPATTTTTEEETTETTTPEPTAPVRKIMPTATPTPVAGLKTAEVYEEYDDTKLLYSKEEFDADGYCTYHADYSGTNEPDKETEYTYKNGLCVSEYGTATYSRSNMVWDTVYTYDDDGRLLTSERHEITVEEGYKMETVCLTTYTYDEYGAILDECSKTTVKAGDPWFKDMHTVYTYDDDGYILSKEVYMIRSSGAEELETRSEYTCDEDGKILTELVFKASQTTDPNDPVYSKIEYEYDAQGRLIKTTDYDDPDDPNDIFVREYIYNDKGLISEVKCYDNDEFLSSYTRVYTF